MTDAKRLKDKLGKLTAPGEPVSAEGRRVSAADLRRAILVEIDETMLPRLLTFTRPDGEALELEVSARRLLRVRAAPGGLAAGDGIEALCEPLVADSQDQLDRVAAGLSGFCAGVEALTVVTARLDRRPDPSNAGRSATAIAEAMGLDLYPEGDADRPDAPAAAAGSLEGLADAAARMVGGHPAAIDGAPAPGPLATVPEAALGRLLSQLGAGEGASLCFRAAGDGPALVLTRSGGEARLYLVPGRRLADALTLVRKEPEA